MTAPEAKVKAKLKRALKALPFPVYQFWPVQTGMGASTVDCLICTGGKFLAVETKAPGKHPTPRQRMLIEQIDEAGGIALVVSTDEEIAKVLDWARLCQ